VRTNAAINISLCTTFSLIQEYKKFAVKVFNSNKYLVTFLLIHLFINSVAGPPAVDVETMSWLLCKQ